jgi:hypothetical protein
MRIARLSLARRCRRGRRALRPNDGCGSAGSPAGRGPVGLIRIPRRLLIHRGRCWRWPLRWHSADAAPGICRGTIDHHRRRCGRRRGDPLWPHDRRRPGGPSARRGTIHHGRMRTRRRGRLHTRWCRRCHRRCARSRWGSCGLTWRRSCTFRTASIHLAKTRRARSAPTTAARGTGALRRLSLQRCLGPGLCITLILSARNGRPHREQEHSARKRDQDRRTHGAAGAMRPCGSRIGSTESIHNKSFPSGRAGTTRRFSSCRCPPMR